MKNPSDESAAPITNTEELHQLCLTLSQEDWMGIDLEFIRERSYFQKIALIQVANET